VNGTVDPGRLIAVFRFTASGQSKHRREHGDNTGDADSPQPARIAAAQHWVRTLDYFAHGGSCAGSFTATVPVRLKTSTAMADHLKAFAAMGR
jgi:hypothetical protein